MLAKPFVQAETSVDQPIVIQPPPKPDLTAPRLVLKQGGTMVLVNPQGLMPRSPDQALGMFADDTRGLHELDVRIDGHPLTFKSGGADTSYSASFGYESPLSASNEAGAIAVESGLVVNADDFYYRLKLSNGSDATVKLNLEIAFSAGFEDTFEVRGSDRPQRGVLRHPQVLCKNKVELNYVGLDAVHRSVQLEFGGAAPNILAGHRAVFEIALDPESFCEVPLRISYRTNNEAHDNDNYNDAWSFDSALAAARSASEAWILGNAGITTGNPTLNKVIDRAVEDINMLRLGRLGIAAGLPQFAVPFGRDSAITGLQTCWLMPSLSRDIILALASYQGTKFNTITAEEPGKIMHELRTGEMVKTGEAPFGPYYGTVDATQLWLMLIGEYTKWTSDYSLSAELWDKIEAAVSFLRRRSRRGFITYGGRPGEALANQCWKDSYNSIMHSDGRLAEAPIAVCEAQGYMYAAFIRVAELARYHGKNAYAGRLERRAQVLRKLFQKKFWMPKRDFVALAIDKHDKRCDVVSSNPGHLLGMGVLTRRQEKLVAQRLMQPDMFNGWFIRTLASSEIAYDESDYQRGSGWPHDNGLAAVGMRTIGHDEDAIKVFAAHVDIASAAGDYRLHELYCGNARTPDAKEPVHYKVACVPQAWAAGSILHMLRACLNPQPHNGSLKIINPQLPDWLPRVTVSRMKIGQAEVDLQFIRNADGKTVCATTRNDNKVKVSVRKRK